MQGWEYSSVVQALLDVGEGLILSRGFFQGVLCASLCPEVSFRACRVPGFVPRFLSGRAMCLALSWGFFQGVPCASLCPEVFPCVLTFHHQGDPRRPLLLSSPLWKRRIRSCTSWTITQCRVTSEVCPIPPGIHELCHCPGPLPPGWPDSRVAHLR